jgi:hypothetical protein
MSDPRNVAHDKKVAQEKQHEHAQPPVGANGKSHVPEAPVAEHEAGELEKSVAVLSKLKEMEFHSRANIETLAELSLTIEDELKQKEFAEPIGALYSAQDGFQSKIGALIEGYESKCATLRPSA